MKSLFPWTPKNGVWDHLKNLVSKNAEYPVGHIFTHTHTHIYSFFSSLIPILSYAQETIIQGPGSLSNTQVETQASQQRHQESASDWLAAQSPANQLPHQEVPANQHGSQHGSHPAIQVRKWEIHILVKK